MSRTEFRGVTVACEAVDYDPIDNEAKTCQATITVSGISDSPERHGWGIVRVYDGKHNAYVIGDQDGWNNFDLCPEHYEQQMAMLGIWKHNIPECEPLESNS